MKPTQLFTIFSVVLFALPVVVFAVEPQDYRTIIWNPTAVAKTLGVPTEWLVVPDILYKIFIPYIVATTVIYGFLIELGLFRHTSDRVNIILALSMAFLLLPSGLLTYIVSVFYAGGAFIALMGFGILFIFGVFLWSKGTRWRLESEYSIGGQIDKIEERIEKYKIERSALNNKGAINLSSKEKKRLDWLNRAIAEEEKLLARMAHK